MKLIDYQFENVCSSNPQTKKILKNRKKYPEFNQVPRTNECIHFFYELKDGVLDEMFDKLSLKQCYGMIVQILYACCLMNNANYYHCDLNIGNIACTLCKPTQTVKIFDRDLITDGYIWSLIDYGTVIHPKYTLSKREQELIQKQEIDIEGLLHVLLLLDDHYSQWYWNEEIENKIKFNSKRPTCIVLYVYLLSHPNTSIRFIKPDLHPVIDGNDIVYMFRHLKHPKKLIYYFMNKMNEL